MANDLSPDDVRSLAEDAGLTHLTEEHLAQLLRATRAARGRRTALRVDTLTPADEPAHVFRLGTERVR